jgi:small GTP-binding protein
MINKKICMLGSFSVGKTSLFSRFIDNLFSDKYHTTVGVKVDKKQIELDDQTVNIMLWDLAGEDVFNKLQSKFLRGSSGFIIVVDGTRAATLDKALELHQRITPDFPDASFVFALNKADLKEEWELDMEKVQSLVEQGWPVHEVSAKSGELVEDIFERLSRAMLE